MKTNAEIEALLAGFRPQFGNGKHIEILNLIERRKKLSARVEGIYERRAALESEINKQPKTEKQLARVESELVAALKEQ